MAIQYNQEAYHANLRKRELRKKNHRAADTLLKDLRLYFTYDLPNTFFYLFNFTESLLRVLRHKDFRCPGYNHIYISIGETEEEAIAAAYEVEDWYEFGIAVLPKEKLMNCQIEKREELILKAITNGLHDIAEIDQLDKDAIGEAVQQVKKWGAVYEKIISENQNKKYRFRISGIPIVNKTKDKIYFSLIDRDEQKEYKWKFGNLPAIEAAWWFFKITVTNKFIRTKPRANMELVLKGKKKELKLSIEEIKNGKGMITMKDIKVPVEPWIIELEKKLK